MLNVPDNMERVIGGKRYRVESSTLLADDQYWDGQTHERHGRNRFLYRTPAGRYFLVTLTMWPGEQDTLDAVTAEEARRLFEEELTEHAVTWEAAFPDATVEEA